MIPLLNIVIQDVWSTYLMDWWVEQDIHAVIKRKSDEAVKQGWNTILMLKMYLLTKWKLHITLQIEKSFRFIHMKIYSIIFGIIAALQLRESKISVDAGAQAHKNSS